MYHQLVVHDVLLAGVGAQLQGLRLHHIHILNNVLRGYFSANKVIRKKREINILLFIYQDTTTLTNK